PKLDGQISRTQSRKRKVKTKLADDWATAAVDFRSEETTNSEVFRKYTDLCATSVTRTCFINSLETLHAKGTQPTCPSPSDRCLQTRVNSEARRGRNPQPVYYEAMSSPFTHNQGNHLKLLYVSKVGARNSIRLKCEMAETSLSLENIKSSSHVSLANIKLSSRVTINKLKKHANEQFGLASFNGRDQVFKPGFGDDNNSVPLIRKKVWTRWPTDNNFYEAVIRGFNPVEGRRDLVYAANRVLVTDMDPSLEVDLASIEPGTTVSVKWRRN
ncbi:EMSY-LIKE 3-like isoform X1, partial [Tanacetum coccineum]